MSSQIFDSSLVIFFARTPSLGKRQECSGVFFVRFSFLTATSAAQRGCFMVNQLNRIGRRKSARCREVCGGDSVMMKSFLPSLTICQRCHLSSPAPSHPGILLLLFSRPFFMPRQNCLVTSYIPLSIYFCISVNVLLPVSCRRIFLLSSNWAQFRFLNGLTLVWMNVIFHSYLGNYSGVKLLQCSMYDYSNRKHCEQFLRCGFLLAHSAWRQNGKHFDHNGTKPPPDWRPRAELS